MANEKRSRTNLVAGALSAGLSTGDTTMSSAGLADLGVIDATNHAAITIFAADGNGRILVKEIVYVTAHTAAATTATIVRGQEGTSAQTWASGATWAHTATTKDFDGSGGGSGLIGLTTYAPAVSASMNTANTTLTALDATNLSVSFTVPPSGKVLVRLTAEANNVSSPMQFWGLLDGGAVVTGSLARIQNHLSSQLTRVSSTVVLTGLTAGAAKSYAWGQKQANGGTVYTYAGNDASGVGPAIMEVWAVNL